MAITTNIQEGNIYYLDTLPDVVLSSIQDDSIVVKLSVHDELVYEGLFVKDFNNRVSLDLHPLVESFFHKPAPPQPDSDGIKHTYANLSLSCSLTAGDLTIAFIIKGMNSTVADRVSNIREIRVPKNYCPILSIPCDSPWKSVEFRTLTGMLIAKEYWPPSESDQQSMLMRSFKLPDYSGALRIVFIGDGFSILNGPIYRICPEYFEQYAFSNEFGGYDNIPMNGVLEFSPEMEFQTIVAGKSLKTASAEATKRWKQHSGFQNRNTIEELVRLVCAKDAYHLSNGKWRQIVITDCNISHKSTDSLHSLTFTYRYADEI